MANLDLDDLPADLAAIRRLARRGNSIHRARIMLVAAGLATLGIVSVAWTLLAKML